jgi:hypothetical protein
MVLPDHRPVDLEEGNHALMVMVPVDIEERHHPLRVNNHHHPHPRPPHLRARIDENPL